MQLNQPVQNPAFISKQSCLTKRETDIVRLLTKGMVPAEIGKRLSISVSTVYKHIANIYKKCSISNSTSNGNDLGC